MNIKKVTIIGPAKKKPGALFAVGRNEGEFYFINIPNQFPDESFYSQWGYFNELKKRVHRGDSPTVKIFYKKGSREAYLIYPQDLGSKITDETNKENTKAQDISEVINDKNIKTTKEKDTIIKKDKNQKNLEYFIYFNMITKISNIVKERIYDKRKTMESYTRSRQRQKR